MTDNTETHMDTTCEITNETDLEKTKSVINAMEHETVMTVITNETERNECETESQRFFNCFC